MENKFSFEKWDRPAAVLIITAACALRLIGLNSSSLTMNEAENALSALELFSGGNSGQMLYALPTALLFKLFGGSDLTARLFPALAGILLAVIPLCLRERIGRRRALLLAFLFAVDPVLLFWSKRADAVIPVIAFLAVSTALFMNGKKTSALTCLLLALSGGERCVPGLVLCLIFGALYCRMNDRDPLQIIRSSFHIREFVIPTVVLALLLTAFGTLPGGPGSFFSGFFGSFRPAPQWAYPGAAAILIAVFVYCGIPLLLYGSACIRERRIKEPAAALILTAVFLLWQGVTALPWIAAFLWIVSADTLIRLIDHLKAKPNFSYFASAFAVAGSYSFFYFRLVEVFNQQNGNQPVQMTWNGVSQTLPLTRTEAAALLTIISVLIIALIVKILLGFAESPSIRGGMTCGIMMIALGGLVTNLWNTGGFDRIGDHPAAAHPRNSLLLLNGNYTSFTDSPMMEIIEETLQKHGDSGNSDHGLSFITDDQLLRWQLRNEKWISFTANTHTDLRGIDLILDHSGNSYESSGYGGIKMFYRDTMHWDQMNFIDWGKWLLFGDGSSFDRKELTIWVIGNYLLANEELQN